MSESNVSVVSNAYAVIIAGGSGERLWPLSTDARPKQFVEVFGGKPLIRHAVDRLAGLIPPERTLVVTAQRLVALTRRALPMIPRANIVGEPCRRDTAAAVAVAAGLVRRLGGSEAVGCILTADQLMTPEAAFRKALADAIVQAARSDAIVTLGLTPTYPATGYGYIECEPRRVAQPRTKTAFHPVRRFVEKPDEATAKRYLKTGRFRWNAGLFIWRVSVLEAAYLAAAPDLAPLIGQVAAAKSVPAALRRLYPPLRAISVDYAVMEKTPNIRVGACAFDWDDVGSWTSLAAHFPADVAGNTVAGEAFLHTAARNVVVNLQEGKRAKPHRVVVFGLNDAVVVHTADATLVCSRAAAGRLRDCVRALPRR